MNFWGMTEDELKANGAFNTAKEIYQQPDAWQETLDLLEAHKQEIKDFVEPLLAKDNIRIIFTGAGTSAYVGDIVAPHLREKLNKNIWAIATTDIVSAPHQYLLKDVPTVLVSFARSGDSPESIGAFDLAEQLVDEIYQVVITCNKNGHLAKKAETNDHTLVFLTPEQTNDLGFAMTSSFSSMLLSSLMIFDRKNYSENVELVKKVITLGKDVLTNFKGLDKVDIASFERLVFLGSGALYGLSRETCLKVLELTAGKIAAISEGIMGFRHGPKSILNDKTLVIMWISSDEYTRQYDLDFLEELYHDEGSNFKVMAVSAYKDEKVAQLADYAFFVDEEKDSNWGKDAFVALDYVLYDHLLAVKASMAKGVKPDTPCPSGSVNRVVKGVTLHALK